MKEIIQVKNLYKYYKDVKAVNNLSFSVNKGDLFAFLGVNGAGKSTTINMLCGQLQKDSGEIVIDDMNMETHSQDIKSIIGVVFQESQLDKNLTVYDNLKYRGALYNLFGKRLKNRIDELASLLEFKDFLKRNVSKLSGGQRRRVDVARAIIHNPKILILDEPTTGLDPYSRKILWQTIKHMQETLQLTVFLTTHYMEETAEANNVIILDAGQIAAIGTPLELKNKYTGDFIYLYNVSDDDILKLDLDYQKITNGYKIQVKEMSEVTSLIKRYPSLFKDYEVIKGTMDDVFLNVTGKSLGDIR